MFFSISFKSDMKACGQRGAASRKSGTGARKAMVGFGNHTQQEIALLYDPDVLTPRHDPKGDPTGKKGAPDAPRFDGVFRWDLDTDAAPEPIRFSKPPLELAVDTVSGNAFRMIGVHAKSKAPHGARSQKEVIRLSIGLEDVQDLIDDLDQALA